MRKLAVFPSSSGKTAKARRNRSASHDARNRGVIVVRAVQHEVVGAITLSVDRKSAHIIRGGNGPWRKKNQLIWITQNERKLTDLLRVNDYRELVIICFDRNRIGFSHVNFRCRARYRQVEVQGQGGSHIQDDIFFCLNLKARCIDGYVVDCRRQSR